MSENHKRVWWTPTCRVCCGNMYMYLNEHFNVKYSTVRGQVKKTREVSDG